MAGQGGNSATGAGSNNGLSISTVLLGRCANSPSGSQSASQSPLPQLGPMGQQHHQLTRAGVSRVPAIPQKSPRRLGHHRRHLNKSPVCPCPFLGRAEFAPRLSRSLLVSSPSIQQDFVPRAGTEGCQQKRCTGALCSAQAAVQLREGKGDRFWRDKHLWPHLTGLLPSVKSCHG